MDHSSSTETTCGSIARSLLRHKMKSLIFVLAVLGAVLVWNARGTKKYRSEAKLLVRLGRENSTLDPTVTLGHDQVMSVPAFRDNEINSVVEVLNSQALAEKVVVALGPQMILNAAQDWLSDSFRDAAQNSGEPESSSEQSGWKELLLSSVTNPGGSPRQQAVHRLMTSLEAASIPRSNVIRITYQGRSPQAAQAILGKLMELFLEEHARLQRPANGEGFLVKQTAGMLEDLQRTDEAIRRLKSETEIISPEGRSEILVKRVGTLEDSSLATAAELAVAEAAAERLRQKLATIPATEIANETQGIGDEGTNRMRDRFYALQIEKQEAKAKLDANHPRMQEIVRQEAAAKEILDRQEPTRSQVTRAPNKAYEQLQLQLLSQEVALGSLKSKAHLLQAQLAEARGALRRFNDQETQIARLQREKDIQDARYRKYASVTEEARVDQALQAQRMTNIGIVQPASLDPIPVLPRKSLNLAAGFAVGLLGAIGNALLAESRAQTLPRRIPQPVRERITNGAPATHALAESRRATAVNAP